VLEQRAVFGDRYLASFANSTTAQLLPSQDGEDATDYILVAVRPLDDGLRLVVAFFPLAYASRSPNANNVGMLAA
jgi:hypothetical protein